MKHVHLTWYILVDGTQADPDDVAPGKDGVLRHKNGVPVALHENGTPLTIGVAAKEGKNVEAAKAGSEAAAEAKRMTAEDAAAVKAETADKGPAKTEIDVTTGEPKVEVRDLTAERPKRGYKTREAKPG